MLSLTLVANVASVSHELAALLQKCSATAKSLQSKLEEGDARTRSANMHTSIENALQRPVVGRESQPGLSANPLMEAMARRPVLQVVDSESKPVFTFPPMSAVDDLYDTVALNNEEVEAFFDDFLSEEG